MNNIKRTLVVIMLLAVIAIVSTVNNLNIVASDQSEPFTQAGIVTIV